MTWYTWPLSLLTMWCRFDLDSAFLSWVLGHEHLQQTFHLHKEQKQAVDHSLWDESVPGVEMHKRMTLHYGNSAMSQWSIHRCTERFKNGCTGIKREEGAGPTTEGNREGVPSLSIQNFYSGGINKTVWCWTKCIGEQGTMLQNNVL